MTGKERYYEREEQLAKVGYLAVLFIRNAYSEDSKKTEELCKQLITDNMNKHGHSESLESVLELVNEDMLKLATKRFGFRSFDAPKQWAEKKQKEKQEKELKRKKEQQEVQAKVEAYKKRYVVKIKKN